MLKLGTYTVNIGGFKDLTELFLSEAAKYLFLLLFAVLAIRLWRRLPKLSAEYRRSNLFLACLSTAIACAIGYFSLCHSLSRLYSYYGMKAFRAERLAPALVLFQTSEGYWKSADTVGEEGVCLLWLDKPDDGIRLLDEANALRKGEIPSFEEFYEGLYYFLNGQTDKAVPLMEKASADSIYRWSVIKLFAVIQLDQNRPQEAAKLMDPFMQVEVTESDQAYIVASLDLFEGKRAEAKMLADKFGSDGLPPFWKSRFDSLRAKIQNPNP